MAVEHVVGLLKEAKKTKGIILSDHNYEAVDKITDKLMFMQDGQTREIAGLEDIKGFYYH